MTERPTQRRTAAGATPANGADVRTGDVRDAGRVTRVMLVDDHGLVRQGLRVVLEAAGDIDVVADAATVSDAVALASQLEPDVVVMDVRLGDGSGVIASRAIRSRRPATRVVLLTAMQDDEALAAAILAGASGYVVKQIRGNGLARTIRAVAAGVPLLDRMTAIAALRRLAAGNGAASAISRAPDLTDVQCQIVTAVASGRTDREIAARLGVPEEVVTDEVARLLWAHDDGSRAEIATILAEHLWGSAPL